MKHSSDEAVVKQKMILTFSYRQKMVHDPQKSSDVLSVFPHFTDVKGLIEHDFVLLFGESTCAKFLEIGQLHSKIKTFSRARVSLIRVKCKKLQRRHWEKTRMKWIDSDGLDGTVTLLHSYCCFIYFHLLRKEAEARPLPKPLGICLERQEPASKDIWLHQ
ncbi:hypothetical protein AOLI_G00126910 [Acnodon oligacanthus]